MDSDQLDDLMALLPPLLQSLEALGFVARHLNPPDLNAVLSAVGAPDEALRAARPRLDGWPEALAGARERLVRACDETTAAFDALRAVRGEGGDMRALFRAMRHIPRAQEALYPLADGLPPLSRYFLDPGSRQDAELMARLAQAPAREDVGVLHLGGEPGARGAYSLYVPEYYSPDRSWPLVMALHGGSGNGRAFLWSWLRDARARGAILVSPTALGETWALAGPDVDTPNLLGMLDEVRGHWNVDPSRLLLTGMSDGGTFSYVSGLEAGSPFTHLGPIAAAFHPMLAQMADPARIAGLPIHLVHGALDWMFPVAMAREARDALGAAGASVTYCELEDLSHTYPREMNPQILAWLDGGP
jgi:phospholipase/carboxylesterase